MKKEDSKMAKQRYPQRISKEKWGSHEARERARELCRIRVRNLRARRRAEALRERRPSSGSDSDSDCQPVQDGPQHREALLFPGDGDDQPEGRVVAATWAWPS